MVSRCQSSEMRIQRAVFSVIAVFTIGAFGYDGETISDLCIGCLCEAASNCERSSSCQGGVCGLFKITQPYWVDANRPTVNNEDPNYHGAYERCTTDIECAAQTVRNYMARYAKDCDGDGRIDCRDFAGIHRYGAGMCHSTSDVLFHNNLNKCLSHLSVVEPSIDVRSGNVV